MAYQAAWTPYTPAQPHYGCERRESVNSGHTQSLGSSYEPPGQGQSGYRTQDTMHGGGENSIETATQRSGSVSVSTPFWHILQ